MVNTKEEVANPDGAPCAFSGVLRAKGWKFWCEKPADGDADQQARRSWFAMSQSGAKWHKWKNALEERDARGELARNITPYDPLKTDLAPAEKALIRCGWAGGASRGRSRAAGTRSRSARHSRRRATRAGRRRARARATWASTRTWPRWRPRPLRLAPARAPTH